jgi:hypothetical protein
VSDLDKNQKYFPNLGYDAPKKTRKPCPLPAFADPNLHRVGMFLISEIIDNGLPGWNAEQRCVNCGKLIRKWFVDKVTADKAISIHPTITTFSHDKQATSKLSRVIS